MNFYSVGKAITATCVLLMVQGGLLDLDSPVVRWWPEFGAAGNMTTTRYGQLAAVLGDGDVLVAGGINNRGASLKSAEVFVAKTGKFVKVAAMPHDRFMVGATVLTSSTILIAGGYTECPSPSGSSCEKPIKTALIFDHRSDSFRSISPMKSPRGSFASATLSHPAH